MTYNTFLHTINRFITTAKSAPHYLTHDAIEKNELTEGRLNKWKNIIENVEQNHEELSKLLTDENLNWDKIKVKLEFYQSLPRWLEEVRCFWSNDLDKINSIVTELGDQSETLIKTHNNT